MASHGQVTYFEASNELLNAKTRPHAFQQMQALGVRALRVELYWADVAPGPDSAKRPSFVGTNPGAYAWVSTTSCSPKPSGSTGRCC